MRRKTVLYVVAFLTTILFTFLYDGDILFGILVFEILYAVVALLGIGFAKRNIEVAFGKMLPIIEKNEEVPLKIQVKSKGWIPSVRFRICLIAGNQLSTKLKKEWIEDSIRGTKKTELCYQFASQYCGNIILDMKYIMITDMLGIFGTKKKLQVKKKIGVLPQCEIIPLEVTRRTREFIADADEYSTERSGDDATELYQIRPYVEKDSLHQIHWKMTAKEGELMVKEHSHPLGCVVLVWLDLCSSGRNDIKAVDKILEIAASLTMTLIEEKCVHMVSWFEEKNQRVVKMKVSTQEHVYQFIHRILLVETYEERKLAKSFYEEAFKGDHFSSVVEIDLEGKIVVNEMQQAIVHEKDARISWDGIYLTV